MAFFQATINETEQWLTKPKFHMLLHLVQFAHEFGPPCLVAQSALSHSMVWQEIHLCIPISKFRDAA